MIDSYSSAYKFQMSRNSYLAARYGIVDGYKQTAASLLLAVSTKEFIASFAFKNFMISDLIREPCFSKDNYVC